MNSVFKFICYCTILNLCISCAQIRPLTGGIKDTVAPKAINFYPKNFSTNFVSKEIRIEFDEIISSNKKNKPLLNPSILKEPEIFIINKKNLIIKLNDTLKPNTTYNIPLHEVIADNNENNYIRNLSYIFSTGSNIDTCNIKGHVYNAFDHKPMFNVLVGLYQKDVKDSVVYKSKAVYHTFTNIDGTFTFNYLPNKKFKIVAFNDVNNNFLYDGFEEAIAFSNNYIIPKDTLYKLYVFKEQELKNYIKQKTLIEYGKALIVFNKSQTSFSQLKSKNISSYYFNINKDSLTLFYENEFDTLKCIINYNKQNSDTVILPIPSKHAFKNLVSNKQLKFKFEKLPPNLLPYFEKPTFILNTEIKNDQINTNNILVYEKTNSIKKPIEFKIAIDTLIRSKVIFKNTFKEDTEYEILFLKQALLNKTNNRSNDSIAFKFKTSTKDDYATFILDLTNYSKTNKLIVQLLNNDQVKFFKNEQVEINSTKKIIFKNIDSNNYTIKIFEDFNNNLKIDTGNYLNREQPERTHIFNTEIKLISGWEINHALKLE